MYHKSKNYQHPLFCCLRNEIHRIPHFLEYYRNLGVDHFFFIDNNSDDGFLEYMKEQKDVSVWFTKHSYRDSNFGMEWCNTILKDYGTNKWCITCDPDEFVIYPNIETRKLPELTEWMDSMNQKSLFTVMIDCYSDKSIEDTHLDQTGNPFIACPYFDKFNFVQQYNEEFGNIWLQGGVRMRTHFKFKPEKAPAQNKVPLVKWQKDYYYVSSMHHLSEKSINCSIYNDDRFVSGALFHFKYISKFKEKVTEEMHRNQHYNSGAEYKRYNESGFNSLYDQFWSIKYKDSTQLVKQKLIHKGEWF